MGKKKQKTAGETFWSFALINGRLADIYFEAGKGLAGISGHGYVKREWYKTKHEKRMLEADTKKYNLIYRNKKYRDKNRLPA